MTIHTPIHQAKTKLTELVKKVEGGERVVITRHGKPVAEIVLPQAAKNTFSFEKMQQYKREKGMSLEPVEIPPDFDDPLPDDFWFPGDDILSDRE